MNLNSALAALFLNGLKLSIYVKHMFGKHTDQMYYRAFECSEGKYFLVFYWMALVQNTTKIILLMISIE